MNLSELKDRARELASSVLDGKAVKSTDWANLAGEQLAASAVAEVAAERAKAERAKALAEQLAGLQARAKAATDALILTTAEGQALDDRETRRQIAEMSAQNTMLSGTAEERRTLAHARAMDADPELTTLKERHADEIERLMVSRRYHQAINDRDEANRLIAELKQQAAAEGIRL